MHFSFVLIYFCIDLISLDAAIINHEANFCGSRVMADASSSSVIHLTSAISSAAGQTAPEYSPVNTWSY